MFAILFAVISYPPSPPELDDDVWSETLQQYIDWIDTFQVLPKSLEYVAYLGSS
jgi:hypothetical protein